jgi:hypothetical protein
MRLLTWFIGILGTVSYANMVSFTRSLFHAYSAPSVGQLRHHPRDTGFSKLDRRELSTGSFGRSYIILPSTWPGLLRISPAIKQKLQSLQSFPSRPSRNGFIPFLRHPCPCRHGSRLSPQTRFGNGEQFGEEG